MSDHLREDIMALGGFQQQSPGSTLQPKLSIFDLLVQAMNTHPSIPKRSRKTAPDVQVQKDHSPKRTKLMMSTLEN
jgi:hypothetical protein